MKVVEDGTGGRVGDALVALSRASVGAGDESVGGRGELPGLALLMCGLRCRAGHPALSRPLTILGVERRAFLLPATLGLAMWNAIHSLVTELVVYSPMGLLITYLQADRALVTEAPA